ncbi:MAG: toxin TcdB middle/N-terminal domain-containing protein [Kofleriaceae bacterium]
MALVAFVQVRATASPGDIFSIAAPSLAADQPKAAALNAGDASVSTQTGALQYTYPIHVPPGRHGMQPSLGLTYSSQAPIYGTVAAGWSIAIPSINVDTSNGRLVNPKAKTYTSSMAGGRPLVIVTETPLPSGFDASYRAQNDTSFTRYLHRPSSAGNPWLAQTTDGVTYYYAQSDHTTGCSNISEETAPLTSMVDSFGNAVDYYYEPGTTGECRISRISWGENTVPGSTLKEFARVTFNYDPAGVPGRACNGIFIGSQTSYRTGAQIVTGASTLLSVTITAFAPGFVGSVVHTRLITLAYSASDASCTATHAAFRSLTSIQESAWGTDSPRVDLPPVTFAYGAATPSFTTTTTAVPWHSAWGGTILSSALSWGQRFKQTTKWPTVEAMLIDVDGDGLLDRVTNDYTTTTVGGGTYTTKCGMSWERNPGAGAQFDGIYRHIDLPTLKWASGASTPYAGGSHANENGSDEICALNYQQTSYINSHGDAGTNLSCPPTFTDTCALGYCSSSYPNPPYGNDCGLKNGNPTTILAYRWIDVDGDGKVDLVASIAQGGLGEYNLQWGNGVAGHLPALQEPPIFGAFPVCPAAPYSDGSATSSTYTMCNGMYPWFVYKNKGAGVFGSSGLPDTILYQPVPLETTTGDSTISGRVVGNYAANVDLDGDGHEDEVHSGAGTWSVFRGGAAYGNAFQPSAPFSAGSSDTFINLSNTTTYGASEPISVTGLFDLNGDGLPDRWSLSSNASNANVEINAAYGFIQNPLVLVRRPGNDGRILSTNCSDDTNPPSAFLSDCTRFDSSRTVDVDGDGRGDLVQLPGTCSSNGSSCVSSADCGVGYTCNNATSTPGVYFNQGGQFAAAPVAAGFPTALNHKMESSSAVGGVGINPYTWSVRSDMIDLDGDGITDGITTFSAPTSFVVSRVNTATPPRLLSQIDNGRGAQTQISYSPLSNSAVVTQDWTLGKVSPRTQWVVHSLSTIDSIDSPATTSTSTVTYKYPVYNLDDLGHYGLRGFEEASTTGPTGAKTTERFHYDIDWRGAHTQTLVYSSETPSNPTSIDTTTWTSLTLFGGHLQTFHPTIKDHLICAPGQTESTCTSTTAAGFSRTSTTFTACAPGTCDVTTGVTPESVMWIPTQTLLQPGTAAANGDRRTSTAFNVYASLGTLNYRTRSTSTIQEVQVAGTWTMYGKKAQTWDADFLTPLTDEVWVDTVDGDRSITQRTYDPATGNVLSRRKPNQTAVNGPAMTYDYDDRKLFVATDHSEPAGYYNLSQQVDYIYEYGTGTKLETKGPNIASCSGPPPYNAPTCPLNTSFIEDSRIQVDGLGRTVDRWETFANASSSYYLTFERERNVYVDASPSSVTTQTAYDFDQNTLAVKFLQSRTDADGHGRPLRKTSYALGAAAADAITTYTYTNAGMVSNVSIPDPTLNTTAAVQYTYSFDSLGRPLTIRRPDSTTPANQSGADLSYSGMTATSKEVVGSAGGKIALTTSTKDIFGRLTKVEETVVGTTKAATNYSYDPADNVMSVVDPTGVTTTMLHDFAGNRIQITRSGATWKYGYDKNGNMYSETFPGSTAATIQNYVNTTVYDDLDRPSGKTIGQRGLSVADIATFGAGYEWTLWDIGANASGRLGILYSYTPMGNQPVTTSQYVYDLNGREEYTSEGFSGLPGTTPAYLRHHTLLGNVQDTYYNDYPALDRATWSNIHYDARGLPSSMDLSLSTSTATLNIAQQTRNVAGLVTKRHTDVIGSPMTFTESNWTYDKLGRVTRQVVQDGPGPMQVARQDLAYFGNDDPKTLDQWLGPTNHKRFTYGFDLRHQITSVGETLLPNAFTATYAYNSAGRFTSAVEAAASLPNSDVKPRNVTYHYNGTDPEQVTSLVNTNSTIAWAYTYDASGNQTMRCAGQIVSGSCTGTSGETDYVYDGNDRLRRATKKSGPYAIGSEEYWYDAHGDRNIIVKKDAAGNKTETIWLIGDTEAHYDGTGSWVHSYANVSMGTPVARVDTDSTLVGKIEYQFHGLANNTLATVDQSTGTINTSLTYAPFGEVIEATNAGVAAGLGAHRRRLNDKYADEISDLSYYGFRYYDKTSMTWTQSDPLYRFAPDSAWGQPRRALLYTDDVNNPLRYMDPDGRWVGAVVNGLIDLGEGAAALGEGLTLGAVALVAAPFVIVAATIHEVVTTPPMIDVPSLPGCGAGGNCTGPNDGPTDGAPRLTNRYRAAPTPEPTPEGPTPSPVPVDLARPRGGGRRKGERNWERNNPNPEEKPDKWRRNGDGTYQRQDPQTGSWGQKVKKLPPGVDPPAAIAIPANGWAPADANHDGNVSNEEESTFMRNVK